MDSILRNWQTSSAGFAAVALAIYHILSGDMSNITEDLIGVAVGFGLIAAKDGSKLGEH